MEPMSWHIFRTAPGAAEQTLAQLEQALAARGIRDQLRTATVHRSRVPDPWRRIPEYLVLLAWIDEGFVDALRTIPSFLALEQGLEGLSAAEMEKVLGRPLDPLVPRRSDVVVGERVALGSGPFANLSGEVTSIDPVTLKVEVAVLIFGKPTKVVVDPEDLV